MTKGPVVGRVVHQAQLPPSSPVFDDGWKNQTCDTCRFMVERDDVPFMDMFDKVQHPKVMECRFGPPQYVEGNSTYPRSWGRAAGNYPVLGFNHPACAQYQRSE
jgi:hypothetical protein